MSKKSSFSLCVNFFYVAFEVMTSSLLISAHVSTTCFTVDNDSLTSFSHYLYKVVCFCFGVDEHFFTKAN